MGDNEIMKKNQWPKKVEKIKVAVLNLRLILHKVDLFFIII